MYASLETRLELVWVLAACLAVAVRVETWIGVLALSHRGVSRFLATDRLVLGGFISFSLYMTHTVWYGLWRAVMTRVGIDGGVLYALATIVLFVGAVVVAWLMWKVVEEPAREWMRGRSGERPKPVEEVALEH